MKFRRYYEIFLIQICLILSFSRTSLIYKWRKMKRYTMYIKYITYSFAACWWQVGSKSFSNWSNVFDKSGSISMFGVEWFWLQTEPGIGAAMIGWFSQSAWLVTFNKLEIFLMISSEMFLLRNPYNIGLITEELIPNRWNNV